MKVHLDTHAAVLLWEGRVEAFGQDSRAVLEHEDLFVSPAVRLELQFLREIDRLLVAPDEILGGLEADCGVRLTDAPFARVVSAAMSDGWTRDPFDRLIVADARLHGAALVSRDRRIRKAFPAAIW